MMKAGVPVQADDPRSSPVQIGFDWAPNLSAIRALIKKANRQLENDAALSSGASGFIVMQARGVEQLGKAIEERFLPNFPPCCLGVTLVSEIPFDNGQIVCRDGVDAEGTLEVMSHAASFSDSLIWRCSESRHFEPAVADESLSLQLASAWATLARGTSRGLRPVFRVVLSCLCRAGSFRTP
jgi:hypothetical protein